ncbi:MAG: glycosyltransferase family 39 protein, partial [bacterium]
MEFLFFALLNGAAAAAAALVVRRFRLDAGGSAAGFLAGTVVFCFQVVISSVVLGHFGKLFLFNLLAAQLILLFVIAAYVLYTEGDRPGGAAREERKTGTGNAAFSRWLYLFFPAAAGFAGLGLLFVYCAISPPPPTDAFLYHLVFPAEWLKSGRISIVQTLSTDQASSYYPANAELLYLWLMAPFHDDVAARFLQWFFAVVMMVCGWGIVRRAGLGKTASAAAAAATLLTPGFFRQVVNCDADIVFTAFFLLAVYFLLVAGDEGGWHGFALGGLAAGLMAGTKSIGVLYCVLLLPLVVVAVVRAKREGRGAFSGLATLWIVCVFAAGGYWYLRNFHATGSPFYPLGLSVGGFTVFPGAYGREAMLGTYLHVDVRSFGTLFEILREHVLGVPLLISAVVVASAGLVARLANRGGVNEWEDRNRFTFFYLVCLPFLAALLFWFVNPYNTHNNYRFLLPVVFFFNLLILCAFRKGGAGG